MHLQVILFISVMLNAKFAPFYHRFDNMLELTALTLLLIGFQMTVLYTTTASSTSSSSAVVFEQNSFISTVVTLLMWSGRVGILVMLAILYVPRLLSRVRQAWQWLFPRRTDDNNKSQHLPAASNTSTDDHKASAVEIQQQPSSRTVADQPLIIDMSVPHPADSVDISSSPRSPASATAVDQH